MLYITLKRQYRKCLRNHLFTYSVPKEEQYWWDMWSSYKKENLKKKGECVHYKHFLSAWICYLLTDNKEFLCSPYLGFASTMSSLY